MEVRVDEGAMGSGIEGGEYKVEEVTINDGQ